MFKKIEKEMCKYEGLDYLIEELAHYQNNIKDINKYGMVLIGPDAFRQSETLNILQFFEEKGFELVDLKIKHLTRTQTENLFLPTSTCTKCGNLKWWMIQDSAAQGVFCSAIFYYRDGSPEHNCLQHLNTFKGNSNPLKNKEGVVRYDFAAINVCLNLVHIPDSYGDFLKDTSPFYKIKEIVNIINKNSEQKKYLKNKLFQLRLYEKDEKKYTFETVWYKTKFNLASLLKNNFEQLSSYYREQYESLQLMQKREKRYVFVKSRVESEIKQIEEIKKELLNKMKVESCEEKVNELIDDINLLRILEILTAPTAYKKYERDIYSEINLYGGQVEEFEKLILNTSLIQWNI